MYIVVVDKAVLYAVYVADISDSKYVCIAEVHGFANQLAYE
jgi:hypothetical protein